MEVEIMPLMTTLGCVDFMFYCTREHPNKEFREQCQLLMYAVSSDVAMFKEYIDKLLTNPNKNLITLYPAIDDESKVEGLEIVGTILDERLYFG